MHVVVVGCGRVGSGLASHLTDIGHTVAVIDRNASSFRRLPEEFGGETIEGIGFDRDLLVTAGIERAGALAAVTNGDNSNILIARIAKETFGIERVVARIYDPRRAQIYQRLGIHTVATSQWTVDQVLRRVIPAARVVEWTDPSVHVSLVEQHVTPEMAGTALSTLDLADLARPVAVTRLGEASLVPADLVLQEGDILHLAVDAARVDEIDARFTKTGAHH